MGDWSPEKDCCLRLTFQKTSAEAIFFTLKMASAQVVETSVTNNSPSQDSNHPNDLFQSIKTLVIQSDCLRSVSFFFFFGGGGSSIKPHNKCLPFVSLVLSLVFFVYRIVIRYLFISFKAFSWHDIFLENQAQLIITWQFPAGM